MVNIVVLATALILGTLIFAPALYLSFRIAWRAMEIIDKLWPLSADKMGKP